MCVIYNFPVKKQLSKELEERFYKLAKEYVELMNDALTCIGNENASPEETAENAELVLNVYLDAISKAIEEY